MKVHNHVNDRYPTFWWPRARKFQIDAGWVKCELDYARAYRLIDGYGREPHVSFMNLKSEDKLAAFVQTWGPLQIPDKSPRTTSWMQIQWYWNFQQDLKVTTRLLGAFSRRHGEKEALEEFLAVKK